MLGCAHQIRVYRTNNQIKHFSENFSIHQKDNDLVVVSKSPRLYSKDIEILFGHPPTDTYKNVSSNETTWKVAFHNVKNTDWVIRFYFVFNIDDLLYKIVIPQEYLAAVPITAIVQILNNYIPGEQYDVDYHAIRNLNEFTESVNVKSILGPISRHSEIDGLKVRTFHFQRIRNSTDKTDTPMCEISYYINQDNKIVKIISDFEGISFDLSTSHDHNDMQ